MLYITRQKVLMRLLLAVTLKAVSFIIENKKRMTRRGRKKRKKKLSKTFMSFMFQGMYAEARVLHKEKTVKKEERRKKSIDREFLH